MASRESQGLQIALILFVMTTVVLAITTYVYFRKAEEQIKKAVAAEELRKQEKDRGDGLEAENQLVKHVLGFERKSEADVGRLKTVLAANKAILEVMNSYEQDMAQYGSGLPEEEKTYRNVPKALLGVIQKRNTELADANAQVNAYKAEKEQLRDQETKRFAQVEAELNKAREDYASVRTNFNTDRTKITEEKTKIAGILTDKDKEIQRLAQQAQKDKEERDKQLALAATKIENLSQKVESQRAPKYETPSGDITHVDQGTKSVWVNLGSADGLERQMKFSVLDQKETGVTQAKKKGSIEITRVMEAHLAEARIVDNPLADPILVGDKIYSPTFRKGQKTHFALAGLIDLNNDGRSDQEKVKAIITSNGGAVDAELLDDGSIAGKMTVETRYLVQGQRPTDKTNKNIMEGYSKMVEKATELGVLTITLDELLNRMGYVPEKRVVPLDRGGTGGSGQQDQFRKRTPRSAY